MIGIKSWKYWEILGSGSRGIVKKVKHKMSGKIYALKITKKRCNSRSISAKREIEVLKN